VNTWGRIAIGALSISGVGLVAVATHEGYTDRAVIPIPGDVPTIGFGTTKGVRMGDKITPPVALRRKLDELNTVYEPAVKRCVHVPLYQHEYDAYVSLAYNIGPTAFCSSTLVRKANASDYAGACAEFSRWVYAGGRVVQGLVNRRAEERKQCEGR